MLDDRKLLAIQLLIDGKYDISTIAQKCGVSRQTLWDWRTKDTEFKGELDQTLLEIKNEGKKKILSNVDRVISNIIDIANNAASERTKLNANTFLYESVYGKAASKTEVVNDQDKESIDPAILNDVYNQIIDDFEEEDEE